MGRKRKSILLAVVLLFSLCGGKAMAAPVSMQKTPSFLLLEGGAEMEWPCGVPFCDPGFRALDRDGQERNEQVQTQGQVVSWKPGEYELRYSFVDSEGCRLQRERRVRVVPAELPETVQREKVVYLSFDDGPCQNTREVLELLEKYDAKASFFVILNQKKYLDLLPEIREAGHSIGIHAYKHPYEWLYLSEESFFEDFMRAQEILYDYTGSYACISRFPGGSRTANGYLSVKMEDGWKGVEQRLADMGIRYYDWNMQIEASRSGSSEQTFQNFCQMLPEQSVPIVLQHDTRDYSVKALEKILQWGTENGYRFEAMDNTVPEVHFYE